MSAAAPLHTGPLRLINLITLLQITGDAKLQARRGSGPQGHPAHIRDPGNGFPPSRRDTKAPTVGSQGGQGSREPQDEK